MRTLMVSLFSLLALAGCAAIRDDAASSAREQQRLAEELGNRVPAAPVQCLPSYRTQDMLAVGNDILFRDGATVYRARTSGGCRALGGGGYILLIDHMPGRSDLCRGDIAKVITSNGGMFAGSCTFEEITPYRRP